MIALLTIGVNLTGRRDRAQPRPLVRARDDPERARREHDGGEPVIRVENLVPGPRDGRADRRGRQLLGRRRARSSGSSASPGSGKTTTALALLGYAAPGRRHRGAARSRSADRGDRPRRARAAAPARAASSRTSRRIRAAPLNPSLRIGDAILDVLRAHRPESASDDSVRVGARARRAAGRTRASRRRYPHQLSGGQQQRVTIAMACVCEPAGRRARRADHRARRPHPGPHPGPSSRACGARSGMAMVYVTHDLAVVARMADRIVVMYAGRVVENGPVDEVIAQAAAPVHARRSSARSPTSGARARCAGSPASRSAWASGRRAARSPRGAGSQRGALPRRGARARDGRARPRRPVRSLERARAVGRPAPEGAAGREPGRRRRPLLEVVGPRGRLPDAAARATPRSADVSFAHRGRPVRRARRRVRQRQDHDRPLHRRPARADRRPDRVRRTASSPGRRARGPLDQRRRIQIVFQNPFDSLNPRHRVGRVDRAAAAGPAEAVARGRGPRGRARCSSACGCRRGSPTASRSSSPAASASASRSPARWPRSPTCSSATRSPRRSTSRCRRRSSSCSPSCSASCGSRCSSSPTTSAWSRASATRCSSWTRASLCEAGGVREVLRRRPTTTPGGCSTRRRACRTGRRVAAVATAIVGGTVVGPDGSASADVLVDDGVVVEVGTVDATRADVIDASGCLVLPGAVDVHTHPFGGVRDDTRSALCGGTTSALAFVDALPGSARPRRRAGRSPTRCPSRTSTSRSTP